jgi:hypothetical protein
MKPIAALPLLLLTTACGGESPLPQPSSVPPTPQTTPLPPEPPFFGPVRNVSVGETVEGLYGDGVTIDPGEYRFYVTAPRSGTLTATLSWDPLFLGTLLKLTLAGQVAVPVGPNWSPLVAQVSVDGGQRYLIVVSMYGADWLPKDRFVLTTRLDP